MYKVKTEYNMISFDPECNKAKSQKNMKHRKTTKTCEILTVFFSVNTSKINIYSNITKNRINIHLSYKKIVKHVKLNTVSHTANAGIPIAYHGLKSCQIDFKFKMDAECTENYSKSGTCGLGPTSMNS